MSQPEVVMACIAAIICITLILLTIFFLVKAWNTEPGRSQFLIHEDAVSANKESCTQVIEYSKYQKSLDKITQLEKANAELIFNRQGDAQKISGFEFEYDRLRLKNIEQSKIIAELKSTVSYYADNYNWRYRDAEKISQRINLNDIGPWTNYTGQTYQIGGAKARETLQRIALLESGSIADSTREKEKAE
jgi:hypothetical protein